ncbi:carboxypeptidase-like regulatory domain-containing protein [Litoribacter populi]|uniref:carboxypeptidase-like regulatory domain-containing protein n=1 Tax=Litoribacter populi TaxID=2598460 RepID=UPI00163D95A6
MKIKIPHIAFFLFFFGATFLLTQVHAQDDQERRILQLSGIILNADSTDAIPGVNVYVPKKGRGTSSNNFGYFSMPVAEGDSVLFTFIGLKKQSFVIPKDHEDDKISLIVTMDTDEILLGEIEVMPYPTEDEFKRAVLALNLEEEMPLNRGNLSPQLLLRWAEEMPASGDENFRGFTRQQVMQTQDRYGPRPLPLLNPFAWRDFIRSIKRGDLKRRDD